MLKGMPPELADTRPSRNQMLDEDHPIHDWYRFVLSFPPHLVREYMERFGLDESATVLEHKRRDLGKTSGFERMYHRVTRLYFGGMVRHLESLRSVLKPGAQLAYVVGDQASYFRIMIRTGTLLAEISERLGYEVVGIDLFRTRAATATRSQINEEVVLLKWPG